MREVIVMGPLPHWPVPLPRLLLDAWTEHHEVPERAMEAVDDGIVALDQAMQRDMAGTGARYLSPLRALCTAQGCLTSVRRGSQINAISFDETHLTAAGSALLMDLLKPVEITSTNRYGAKPQVP